MMPATMPRMLSLALILLIGMAASSAQTQSEMNEQSCTALKKSDAQLNQVYREVLKKHQKDARFLTKFKTAQRAWIIFRDAEMKAIYPSSDLRDYGSVFPMCECDNLNSLTQDRIKQLQEWLTTQEGDVCAGTKWP